MTVVLRCPGYHAHDGSTRHNSWRPGKRDVPSERYYCESCDAHYPYLVNVAASPVHRYVATGPLGPVMPSDTNDYGNRTIPNR